MKESCLKFVRSFQTAKVVGYSTEQFFVMGKKTNRRGVKFLSFGVTFDRVFLQPLIGAKAETIAPATIRQHNLTKRSLFEPIYAELGGRPVALTIGQLAALLASHPEKEGCIWLLVPVIEPKDPNTVWAVYCDWGASCWRVEAYSFSHPDAWAAGPQVFSRDSEPLDPL